MNHELAKPKPKAVEDSVEKENVHDLELEAFKKEHPGKSDELSQSSFSKEAQSMSNKSMSKKEVVEQDAKPLSVKTQLNEKQKSSPLFSEQASTSPKTILDRLVDYIAALLKSIEKLLITRKEPPKVKVILKEEEKEEEEEELSKRKKNSS